MSNQSNSTTQTIHTALLRKRMLQGAAIALIPITVFLLNARPDPDWSTLWMIRPLVIVPAAGAMGGLFYCIMSPLRGQGGWERIYVNILCLIVYVVGLWLGMVLGLDGTYWD
jgi:hypothetical protein